MQEKVKRVDYYLCVCVCKFTLILFYKKRNKKKKLFIIFLFGLNNRIKMSPQFFSFHAQFNNKKIGGDGMGKRSHEHDFVALIKTNEPHKSSTFPPPFFSRSLSLSLARNVCPPTPFSPRFQSNHAGLSTWTRPELFPTTFSFDSARWHIPFFS